MPALRQMALLSARSHLVRTTEQLHTVHDGSVHAAGGCRRRPPGQAWPITQPLGQKSPNQVALRGVTVPSAATSQ